MGAPLLRWTGRCVIGLGAWLFPWVHPLAAADQGARLLPAEVAAWSAAVGGNGHYYQPVSSSDGINWADAQAWAVAHGGYLVTVSSEPENLFVFNLVADKKYWQEIASGSGQKVLAGPWLGAVKSGDAAEPEAGWSWINSEGNLAYFNWAAGQPNNSSGKEDRIQYYSPDAKTTAAVWNDTTSTSLAHGFVVEFTGLPVQAAPPGVQTFSKAATSAPAPGAQALTAAQMQGVVLIESGDGTATGFIATVRDLPFVVTNLHVLGDNAKLTVKTLSGQTLPVQGIIGAMGADIALLRLAQPDQSPVPLPLVKNVISTVKIGDQVTVVGNRLGGGVATQVGGKVLGLGPDRVEIDAQFQPGNSGSPVFQLGSGEVLGIAAYAETIRLDKEQINSGAAASEVTEKRWFAFRLDTVAKWQTIDAARWQVQMKRVKEYDTNSMAILAFVRGDFRSAAAQPKLRDIISQFESKMGASALAAGTAPSDKLASELRYMVRRVQTFAEDDARGFLVEDYYDYFQTAPYWRSNVGQQSKLRDKLVQALKDIGGDILNFQTRVGGKNAR